MTEQLIDDLRKLVERWNDCSNACIGNHYRDVGYTWDECAIELTNLLDAHEREQRAAPTPLSTCRDCGQLFESNTISPHVCEACQAVRSKRT